MTRYGFVARTRAALIGFAVLFGLAIAPPVLASDNDFSNPPASSYSVSGVEIGGFVSDYGGSAEINSLMPLYMPSAHEVFFLGFDGKLFEGGLDNLGDSVYNVGTYLGYRTRINELVLGAWLGVDRLQTAHGHTYNRAIMGAEYYGPRLIARASGFVPFDDTSDEWSVTTNSLATTTLVVETADTRTTIARTSAGTATTFYDEKVPHGFDAEVGLRLGLPSLSARMRPGELRAFAGVYDFMGLAADGGDVLGGRGRLELDLYPFREAQDVRLTLEGSYSYDDHSRDQVAGGLRLAIPLGLPIAAASNDDRGVATQGGSLKDEPTLVATPAGPGKDLFQPVRRNRDPVSIIRVKRRVATNTVTDTVEDVEQLGMSLANVCGGTDRPIPFVLHSTYGQIVGLAPDLPTTLSQGDNLGNQIVRHSIPLQKSGSVRLDLGSMHDLATGKTLATLLAGHPKTLSGFFYLRAEAPYNHFLFSTAALGHNSDNHYYEGHGISLTISSDNTCLIEAWHYGNFPPYPTLPF